ncbi:hypothetical protein [Hyphomonas sp.]|uniref:hypothetical protein n=1 Tax=Hyphomonas sp. TaxID=87 RepID=UPI0025C14B66|nr:hypothetical protein [Hyphomonas sp.]
MSEKPAHTRQTDARLLREILTCQRALNAAIQRGCEAGLAVQVTVTTGRIERSPGVDVRAFREVSP